MTPTPAPTVSFASDFDGDLHMFSQDPDTATWRVFVIARDLKEYERKVSDQFIGCYWRLAPGEPCWYVDDVTEGMFIEIRRPGAAPARAVHPRWKIWQARYAKGEEPSVLLERWGGARIQVVDMQVHHKSH